MGRIEEDYQPIIDILDDVLGEHRMHNDYTGQLTYCCPTCSYDIKGLDELDDKYNLEVNYKLGVFKCWCCSEIYETKGTLNKLFKTFGTKRQLKQYLILKPEDDEKYVREYKKVHLPKEFISFKNVSFGLKLTHYYKQAFNYIKCRNISDDMVEKYNIGFCYEGVYANRIIIPSYNSQGELNYFIARSYESKPKMKYKNPEAQKEIIVFNESLIDWNKPIRLVEGAFDSIFVDNAIPMLGKVLSDSLFELLYEKAQQIIITLDPDAYDNELKIYHKLNGGRLYGNVYLTHLTGDSDIADLKGDLSNNPPFQLK